MINKISWSGVFMKYYAAFLEGLTPLQEEQLTCILFYQLCSYLKENKKKFKRIIIDEMNEKIWQQEKLFFHYNKSTRLLETECVKQCQAALVTLSKKMGLDKLCFDFFKNLKFAPFKEEALMLSDNGLLFSQSSRSHKNKNIKQTILFDGLVSSEFAVSEILKFNSGLIFGHIHTDFSSYSEMIRLLPVCKQHGAKVLYLELPYSLFSPLFEKFNNDKNSDINTFLTELKKGTHKLYQEKVLLTNLKKLLIAARKEQLKLQACDVNSLNFINQSGQILDAKHRLQIGNACMLRSIETLQFKQKYPKFLLLVGLAHAQTIAQALDVPSSFIGDKKEFQECKKYAILDYAFFRGSSSTLHASESNFFIKPDLRLNQTMDPKISQIISHWDELFKKIPRFSSIAAREIKTAKEVYIEYILEKSRGDKREISDICKTQQSLVIESLTEATYSKAVELAHPKNWYPLFYCQRPYGIRLADNENYAFTLAHLNALETSPAEAETSITKLHYA